MSEYLLPNKELSIEQQRNIFEIRNNMTNIPSNFTSEKDNANTCICGKLENMKHIYYCEKLNKEIPTEKYDQIFGNNLNKMKYIVNRFRENMKQRENKLSWECHTRNPSSVGQIESILQAGTGQIYRGGRTGQKD